MNAKNSSVLMTGVSITQPNVGRSKGHKSANSLHRHNSASAVAAMRTNQRSESYKSSCARPCKAPFSEAQNIRHHVIRSASLSVLSNMNATSV
jgi:hypothetical protein